MSYELQVYSLSPRRPSPREILSRASESGLVVEMSPAPGATASPTDTKWERLLLRSADASAGGFLIEASPDLDRMKAQLRVDRDAGENIPDQVLEATALYVLELDAESPTGEEHQAAFVVAAWAVAGLTEGIVFDPQEEFFADADSFWAVITDEALGDESDGDDSGDDDGDDGGEGEHEHGGGCCSVEQGIVIDLPTGSLRTSRTGRGNETPTEES
jgi:hypothetical protein